VITRATDKFVEDGADLARRCDEARQRGFKVVLTNGTFDVVHVGHVRCLEEAKDLGDLLVVGINADASVRAYKGPERPLVPERERAEVVGALGCVDLVHIFQETTAEALLRLVRPHVWAKGTDYAEDTLPEGPVARELGALVAIVGDPKEHAATRLVAELRNRRQREE
jgi:rfaE bifunctional protein nucleotidyltransferase chain/domain